MARGQNREILLEKGWELFHADGYEATGVGEITRSARVPKGSFYNYFDSKESFALEVLERYVESGSSAVTEQLEGGSGPHLMRLRRLYESWIDQFAEVGFTQGCLAGSMCQEMAGREPAFRDALSGAFDSMRSVFVACLQRAQDAGELPPSHDVDRLARFMSDAWQGAMMRMKVERSDRSLREFIELIFNHVLA